ncbi:PD-(D/E)XK nuclease family protein [Streptomyces sp. OfavH-34-F]|uniref:PD-(D/E)XK nuclease family protein n=1 Tax=Streptomyces sp. OfavH-34-F TaxID=2917760 RepID=UPI001EF38006|nr:PD-(D/E)XK nuclease family protein [Streptomyces sp. OfavH-34-F]MCG7524101.1 PD-(D/E)XK nuclease family protein [Streptomyces sp. OfavH-34-F]
MGPLHRVLDLIEFKRLAPEDALATWRADHTSLHPALAQWTEHAVHGYLAAVAALPAPAGSLPGEVLEPVSRLWARQRGPLKPGAPDVHEEMVMERRYAGHGVRELRILCKEPVEGRPRDEAEIAVAVGVLASGRPVLSNHWGGEPLRLGTFEPARLVRLVEIGCTDASHRILFEGSREAAYARYDEGVEARIEQMIAGGSYRPGSDCGRCDAVASCPAVPSTPGLLGPGSSDRPRRAWSMTTGRTHHRCPARSYLQSLFLPRDTPAEDTEAIARGNAVHAWIEDRHRRTPPRPCEPDDVPGPSEAWQYRQWSLTGLQARLGIQMIGDHALTCPLREQPEDMEVQPERTVVAYDADAEVVVIGKPDLIYRAGDRWTLRETKTSRFLDQGDLLDQYPQLALAVLLAGTEALPGKRHCAVELERLTAGGPVVTSIDAAAPDIIARARAALTPYVAPWHADIRYPARAGKACEDCPFTRWCPDAASGRSA